MYVRGYQPKTIGFNTKPVQFQIILGYPYFRKPPYVCITYIYICMYVNVL